MKDIRYLTDHFDEKIKRINDLDAELNFVFITDQHHNLMRFATGGEEGKYEDGLAHVEAIRYILERCPKIQCVISGGDIGEDYNPDPDAIRATLKEITDALYSLPVPVHCIIGNHDDALGVSTSRGWDNTKYAILPDEMHKLCMRSNPTDQNYYYIDFEEQDYRFIFLNTSDKPYIIDPKTGQYPFGWRLEISNEQAIWFEKEALATDRNIIVFAHSPIHNDGYYGTENPPIGIKPYDDLLNGPRVYYHLKQAQNVVAMIYGHVHFDNMVIDDGIIGVTTLCDMYQKWAPSCPDRKLGDITETAFDVFSFKKNMMYITRFGAGCDRMTVMPRHKYKAMK